MFFRYGTYTFAVGEPGVVIDRMPVKNSAQRTLAVKEQWTIDALVKAAAATASSVSSSVAAIEAAFADDGKDFGLLLPDGSKSTNWVLNADCLGGTRVIQAPSYPRGGAGEYVGFRTVRIVVEGIVLASDADAQLVSFRESVKRKGGGPRSGHIECLTGFPVKQTKRQHTVYYVTQTGEAVGYRHRPRIPVPLWPAALVEAGDIEDTGNERIGDNYYNFGARWSYMFESGNPLQGLPHAWVG